MNYKKEVVDALDSLNIPVEWLNYDGTATTYITFFRIDERGEAWAEDQEVATGYYIQIDLWSLANTTTLEGQIKAAMAAAGWTRTSAQDFYEKDTGIYHVAIRFAYVKKE